MRGFLLAVALLLGQQVPIEPSPLEALPPLPEPHDWAELLPPQFVMGQPLPAATPPRDVSRDRWKVTAYCLTGNMASGRPTFHGAAASWRVGLGVRVRVVELDLEVTVLDRTGRFADGTPTTDLDLAWPGECDRARRFGVRRLTVEVLGR